MNLLVVTQKVDKNDSNLGFFHEWIKHFAEEVEKLTVICLEEGEHNLPGNVEVYSLGKEISKNRLQILSTFYFLTFSLRHRYDAVFIHMNPEYVLLGGLLWRMWDKRIGLWYTHKSVTAKLRVAALLSHIIFTASKESFRLKSKKLHIMGHGIDVEGFSCNAEKKGKKKTILSTGRISESKNLNSLIDAAVILKEEWRDEMKVYIVGEAITEADKEYEFLLKLSVGRENLEKHVSFEGAVSHEKIPDYLKKADVFVNLSDTGSMDKAVLEAMASCVLVVSSNEAYKKLLKPHELYVRADSPRDIARAIKKAVSFSNTQSFREYVEKNHSLKNLIPKIVKLYGKTS